MSNPYVVLAGDVGRLISENDDSATVEFFDVPVSGGTQSDVTEGHLSHYRPNIRGSTAENSVYGTGDDA